MDSGYHVVRGVQHSFSQLCLVGYQTIKNNEHITKEALFHATVKNLKILCRISEFRIFPLLHQHTTYLLFRRNSQCRATLEICYFWNTSPKEEWLSSFSEDDHVRIKMHTQNKVRKNHQCDNGVHFLFISSLKLLQIVGLQNIFMYLGMGCYPIQDALQMSLGSLAQQLFSFWSGSFVNFYTKRKYFSKYNQAISGYENSK